jgi:hypothetical protein
VTTSRYRNGSRSSSSDGGLFSWFTDLWRREPPAYRSNRSNRDTGRKPLPSPSKKGSGWFFTATAPDYKCNERRRRGDCDRGRCDDDNQCDQQQCCITHCEPCRTVLAPMGNGTVAPVALDPVTGQPLQGPVTYVYAG